MTNFRFCRVVVAHQWSANKRGVGGVVKGQFFILTQAVFFNDPYCSFLLDNYYCSIGPILASFFFLIPKKWLQKNQRKKRSVGIHFGTSGLDFFCQWYGRFFVSISHPFFFKVQMQNQILGRCSFVVMMLVTLLIRYGTL